MAHNAPSPSAKGKGKFYGPPTRTSPRLAALRAQATASPQFDIPTAQLRMSRLQAYRPRSDPKGSPPSIVPSLKKLRKRKSLHLVVTWTRKRLKKTTKENPEEAAGGNTQDEDNLADFWASMDLSSKSNDWNDYWNYDGDLDNWRNAEPATSSAGSCTGPPPPTSN
ncbi:hypothetical protein PIB30_076054 [Stylosanthes scabra]|uniref:Uncharacterized protein n=1 Tax=Stylosanthes scabra TaxID=79078 RepID=A0ABU6QQQ2_9FABA|nr:hypothetical protein [Stylosanthes scabra]